MVLHTTHLYLLQFKIAFLHFRASQHCVLKYQEKRANGTLTKPDFGPDIYQKDEKIISVSDFLSKRNKEKDHKLRNQG